MLEARAEGSLTSILFTNADLVEATSGVDLCEVLGSTEAIKKLEDVRQGVLVLDCDPVDGAVVCADAEFSGSAFLDEEATYIEGGGAWLNESFSKEFIELSLHFFGLENGELVGWSTRRSVAGFQINGTGDTMIRRDVVKRAWTGGGGTTNGAEKSIVLKGTGEEVGEGHGWLVGEGGCDVLAADPLEAGNEDIAHLVVGNVSAKSTKILDGAVSGAVLAKPAKPIDVVVYCLLRPEGGREEGGPLEKGVGRKTGRVSVGGFGDPPAMGGLNKFVNGDGKPVDKGDVVEFENLMREECVMAGVECEGGEVEEEGSGVVLLEGMMTKEERLREEWLWGGVEEVVGQDVEGGGVVVTTVMVGALESMWRMVERSVAIAGPTHCSLASSQARLPTDWVCMWGILILEDSAMGVDAAVAAMAVAKVAAVDEAAATEVVAVDEAAAAAVASAALHEVLVWRFMPGGVENFYLQNEENFEKFIEEN
ncbi:hypothetical protein CBR_g36586 [Chara braunii]|uniref:Uncharacterized protein n=1 Tax=Chara braunii TaxID=69332 RepID=A0A388JZ65_CHABU|nr:hypothetical protein CBR_g36586 [Chara braunii]|eukprot:GBG63099.1 hypothetical protein CBR_g36586 [Chara braunii]